MHTRSYVAKVAVVACSLVLTCGYIYYRSMSSSDLEAQASANSDTPRAKDNGSGGAKANANAKQAKMMMGGSKSAVIFTLIDSPTSKGGGASRP
jgi:hypothetical protein